MKKNVSTRNIQRKIEKLRNVLPFNNKWFEANLQIGVNLWAKYNGNDDDNDYKNGPKHDVKTNERRNREQRRERETEDITVESVKRVNARVCCVFCKWKERRKRITDRLQTGEKAKHKSITENIKCSAYFEMNEH